jgi:hypothetical protein
MGRMPVGIFFFFSSPAVCGFLQLRPDEFRTRGFHHEVGAGAASASSVNLFLRSRCGWSVHSRASAPVRRGRCPRRSDSRTCVAPTLSASSRRLRSGRFATIVEAPAIERLHALAKRSAAHDGNRGTRWHYGQVPAVVAPSPATLTSSAPCRDRRPTPS